MRGAKLVYFFLLSISTLVFFAFILKSSQKKIPSVPVDIDLAAEGELLGTTAENGQAFRVIDGDTIVLANGDVVRYIGVDTPENPTSENSDCFAREALERNRRLVEGKSVRLEKDISETDRYGRLLRYVWVSSASLENELLVNDVLVSEGYAKVATFPPDVKYESRFLSSQAAAKATGSGLWGGCGLVKGVEIGNVGIWECSEDYYDCDDFASYEEAQKVYEYCGGPSKDIHDLVSDQNGNVCGVLP